MLSAVVVVECRFVLYDDDDDDETLNTLDENNDI